MKGYIPRALGATLLLTALIAFPRESAMAADFNPGDLFVSDLDAEGGGGAIFAIDRATGSQELVSSGGHFIQPAGIAFDATGQLIVADFQQPAGTHPDGKLIRVDPVSGAQTLITSGGLLAEPIDVAVAANGDLLVIDQAGTTDGRGAVVRVDPVSGQQTLVSAGGLFGGSKGIALSADGSIWVAAAVGPAEGAIIEVDPATGTQELRYGFLFSKSGGAPFDLAFQGDDLLVTVENSDVDGLLRIDTDTGEHSFLTTGGALFWPANIAVESNGGILIADLGSGQGPGGVAEGGVIAIDPITGDQSVVSSLGLFVRPIGIAIVPEQTASCSWGGILPPVNQVDSSSDPGVSGFKHGSRGVVPAKFELTCDGNLVDEQTEADALGPVTLGLRATLDNGADVEFSPESLVTGSANTGSAFRFDDGSDQYIYNIAIKGLQRGAYRIEIAGAGDTRYAFFRIV